ncbi:hypothetical protein ACT3SQ_01350 [Brachybacterium sp. AOP42-C2-15]|uniref:hypothetical protein n=1 Tax=unclassified Brachybacterium TaxID=2623841 RepID=UPI00402A9881
MTFYGMIPEEVRAQADRCATGAEQISSLQQRLDGIVRGTSWAGPDRDDFVSTWTSDAAPGLARLETLLTEHAAELRGEAEEQDRVSGEEAGDHLASLFDDAGEWLWERAEDVGGWFRDRAEEVEDWFQDRVEDVEDWFRDRFHDTFGDAADPDRPWAEIFAEDVVEMLVEDEKLDHPSEVEVLGSREITGSEAPENLEDLVLDNDESRRTIPGTEPPREYDPMDEAQIRIQTVTGADGVERYIVHVPPTQGAPMIKNHKVLGHDTKIPDVDATLDGWNEQGQPFGWDNNLYAMAGMENAGANAVKEAMREAGIPEGSEIAFVGHSQGGLVAAQLADDPSFNGGSYQVTDIFSVGSPVQTYTPADPRTDVLNVQHVEEAGNKGDFVPTLDLEGGSHSHPDGNPAPNVRDVAFGTPGPSDGFTPDSDEHQAHDSVLWNKGDTAYDPDSAYYGTVRNNGDDPALAAKDERMRGKYFGEGTSMGEDVVVDVRRSQ